MSDGLHGDLVQRPNRIQAPVTTTPNRVGGELAAPRDAYQLAKLLDPTIGTLEEWIASLEGAVGPVGPAAHCMGVFESVAALLTAWPDGPPEVNFWAFAIDDINPANVWVYGTNVQGSWTSVQSFTLPIYPIDTDPTLADDSDAFAPSQKAVKAYVDAETTRAQEAEAGLASINHTHDDRYYTETETDSLLSGKVPNARTVNGKALSADITLSAADVGAQAAGSYAPLVHNHDDRYYTETETDTLLSSKVPTSRTVNGKALSADITLTPSDIGAQPAGSYAPLSHTHDDRYYTETETDSLLSGKVPTTRTVNGKALSSDVTLTPADIGAQPSGSYAPLIHNHDDRYYTETETDSLLSGKVPTTRTVNGKALSADITLTPTDIGAQAAGSYAPLVHTHDDRYYTETETDSLLSGKVPTTRTVNGKALSANITLAASDVGAQAAGSYATLDESGKVPAAQLPSYVDDVLEYADVTHFPVTGTAGVIYVALDTGLIYRWSGSTYVIISPSPGSTDAVPEGSVNQYFTPGRAAAAAPVQSVNGKTNVVVLTAADVGAATSAQGTKADSALQSAAIGVTLQAYAANLDTWSGKTPYSGTITITSGKTLNVTASVTLSGTDGSTLNIGAGGTLGTLAFQSNTLSGANTGDVTISTANGLSIIGQALSMATASASVTGALSSTDWSTFSGKVPPTRTVNGKALSADITLTPADIGAQPAGSYAPLVHTHDDRYYTETETDSLLSGKVPTTRTVNSKALSADITLTPSDIGAQPAGSYAPLVHTHDDRYYTETEVDSLLSGKVPTSRTVNGRALSSDITLTPSDIGAQVAGSYAPLVHNHDDRYYTETETDSLLSGKVPTTRTVNGKALSADITLTASDVGADAAGAAAAVQTNLDTDKAFTYAHLHSGVLSGGALSVNADTTKFNISDGVGYIVDYWTTPGAPVVTRVTWSGKTAQSSPYRTSSVSTTVLIDSTGAVTYQTDPASRANYSQYIVLGKLLHPNKSTINGVSQYQHSISGSIGNGMDLMHFMGTLASGVLFSPHADDLLMTRSAGTLLRIGGNYVADKESPNLTPITSQSIATFSYRYRDGTGGFKIDASGNTFQPNVYDNGTGTLHSVGNSYANHRVYVFSSGNAYIVPGQTTYNSLSNAVAAIPTEDFVVDPQLADANLRTIITCRGSVSSLQTSNFVRFTQGGLFGVLGGTAGGSSSTTIPGGSSYDIQYNNGGYLGGATISGLVKAQGASGPPVLAVADTDYMTPSTAIALSIALS
jgi:hypothetical protein